MAVQGPDKGYSWVIVICCSYIHFALFGLFRCSGVMYVAMIQTYDVTREEASWPFSLCAAVFQLVGPVASMLTHYVSHRKVCLLGAAIATFGMATCYFAHSILWINVFLGLVHGLGFGFIVTVVPITLNQYFVKYRATAMGIAFAGGTVSSLIFPIIMEWMLATYTLRDSFLLLSGVVMNTLVASALLREPAWLKDKSKSGSSGLEDIDGTKYRTAVECPGLEDCSSKNCSKVGFLEDVNGTKYRTEMNHPESEDYTSKNCSKDGYLEGIGGTKYRTDVQCPVSEDYTSKNCSKDKCLDGIKYRMASGSEDFKMEQLSGALSQDHSKTKSGFSEENRLEDARDSNGDGFAIPKGLQSSVVNGGYSMLERVPGSEVPFHYSLKDNVFDGPKNHAVAANHESAINELALKEPLLNDKTITIVPKKPPTEPKEVKSHSSFCHSVRDIMKEPMFHFLTFTMCIYFLVVHSFFMVIVDFAKDKGIEETKAIYIISMFSLTDMFGRAGLGWVTDRNFISRKTMVAIDLAVLGIVNQLFPLIDSLAGILAVSAVYGLAVGSSITLFFVLEAELLGMERLTMVVGLTGFINGIASLLRPGIIGLFRDVIGAYDWMFHFLGFLSLVFSVLWLVQANKSKETSKRPHNREKA